MLSVDINQLENHLLRRVVSGDVGKCCHLIVLGPATDSESQRRVDLCCPLWLCCRLTDAGQPSVEHVCGMFAAMQGPGGSAAPGHLSDDEGAEYGPKQPDSKVVPQGQVWLAPLQLHHSVELAAERKGKI